MKLKDLAKNSLLRPWDGLIILLLVLLSFAPVVVFSLNRASSSTQEAVLSVDGEEIKTFDLSDKSQTYTYRYEEKDGDYNLIEVKDGRIRIKEADCGDQICVRRGWIDQSGETIVCLPHKLLIEIKSSDGGEPGSVIY
ncbi:MULTISPECIES: NusG domain II-containing protein [Enterococcus]|uniref:NusG domain II-containing protein n=1 Tax=Enterococcus TaxID=1350 RepID=UPI0005D1F83A|nr:MULTISPECIES: NusG domain II-containing protein [Enterococcus]MBS5819866.1 NusG domain II-containing protein [Enterococcus gilvus]MDN6003742.1 NusG domain II-containing protein [Enterococcus sp.]MDN6217003.1 NusG domain II-containing protein [Enterococcus sp.]MDN6517399.1 NusG domain II-containing protein [Enterococcus sp.]MDN6561405.1 NusG domain II-containing protein [Enterococcus sp.]